MTTAFPELLVVQLRNTVAQLSKLLNAGIDGNYGVFSSLLTHIFELVLGSITQRGEYEYFLPLIFQQLLDFRG